MAQQWKSTMFITRHVCLEPLSFWVLVPMTTTMRQKHRSNWALSMVIARVRFVSFKAPQELTRLQSTCPLTNGDSAIRHSHILWQIST